MRTSKLLCGFCVLSLLFCVAASFGQNPPPTPVPLITEVTPPSLSPTTLSPGSNFTLTILGANLEAGEVVTVYGPGGSTAIGFNTTVNATGTQMVVNFSNVSLPVPGTLTVTVTKRAVTGGILLASNPYYLPVTPSTPTVTLESPVAFSVQGSPTGVAAADFNHDGVVDLAVVSQIPNANAVSILMGNLGGTFTAGASYPTGNLPSGIVAADFNGDGIPDLAITNTMDNTVTILLGNGDGTFRAGATVSEPGVYPWRLVAADFNGDGKMDLAVVNVCGTGQYGCFPVGEPTGPGNVAILLGNGDGTFTVAPTLPATGTAPLAIEAADLNQDGFIDLIVANASNTLTLLMGNGDGTFSLASNTPSTGFTGPPKGIAIGDFNGDGTLDVAVTSSGDGTIAILLNQNCVGLPAPQCSLTPSQFPASVSTGVTAIATADMNGDGLLDLVVANSQAGTVSVLLGDGTGHFTLTGPPPNQSFSAGGSPQSLALIDFNQDGRLDVVTEYSVLRQASVMQLQLTPNNLSIVYGYVPTFTVQLMPPFGAPAGPTGIVSLLDGSTAITSVNLSGTQYQIQFVLPTGFFFGAGTHQLTAVYSGDANFAPVTSNAVTETVATSATTTTLSSNVTSAPYGIAVTLTAGIQPQVPAPATGTVTFTDTTNSTTLGTATVSNNSAQLTLTNLGAGLHAIVATYQGDANCTGSASSSASVTVTPASTTVNLSASLAQAQFAQTVTFTAALQTQFAGVPTGTMSFYDGSTLLGTAPIANNSATFSTSTLAVGSHIISAQYSGDTNFQGASSGPTPIAVTKAATTTIVSSSLTPSVYGQNVTFSATTTPAFGLLPTPGQISFFDGTTLLATVNATNGVAQYTLQSLTGGTHSITAQWLPTSNYATSTSSPLAQTVTPAATTLTLSTNINPSYYGQQILLNISLNPAYNYPSNGATFTVFDNGSALGTLTLASGSSGSFPISTLTAGTHVLTATYGGDANLQASSTTSGLTQTVNQASTTSSASLSSYSTLYGASVTISATVSSPSTLAETGTFSFYDGTTLLGTAQISGARAQFPAFSLLPGTHPITVQYNGDANFLGSTSSPAQTLTISKDPTLTSVSVDVNPSTYGQTVTLTAAVQLESGSGATGSISLLDGTTVLGTAPYNNGGAKFAISTLGGGSHSITAQYAGDAYFASSTSAALTETVNQAPTSITVTSGTNPSIFGQPFTLTATVQPPAGTTATGSITFMDGSNGIGTSTLANNTAQLTVSSLGGGSHNITAVYAGNANLAGSTSSAITETITQAATTTAVTSNLNPASFGQCVQLSATVQPAGTTKATGTVSFLDGSTSIGTGTLANNAATLSYCGFAGGTHTITANYGGDSNYASSTSGTLTETVNPASSSVTLASSPNPASFGSAVGFTATVVPSVNGATATGSVTFYDGSTSLGTATVSGNSAQLNVSSLAVGSHSITAQYAGDTNFSGSTSAALGETVNLATTTTTLASSLNPATFGQAVTLTANVQAGSGVSVAGMVTFLDGSIGLGTVALSNNSAQLTTSTLAPGPHTLTAVYNSNGSFAGSTSAALTETVNQTTTTTTLASSANPALAGQSVTFTATVQAGAGNSVVGAVTFLDGSTTLGSTAVINNAAQLTISTLAIGSHSITAAFQGSTDFASSTSSVLTETVNQSSTTTTLVSNLNPAIFGQGVPLVATVQTASGGAATGTVTFYDGTNVLGIAGVQNNVSQHNVAQLTFAGFLGGTHTLTAAYSGDPNYTASTSSALTETVNPASSSVTVGASSNPSTFGQSVTLTATVVPSVSGTLATGAVTFFDGATSLGNASLSNNVAQISVGNFALGAHSITAAYAGDRNFSGSTSAALSEVVNPAATATVVSSSANPAVVKTNVTFTATVSSSSAGTQSGTVSFYLDGSSTAAASVNLSNGTANYSTNSLSAGSHSVVAVFNSTNAGFTGSTSSALTQYVSDFTVGVSPSSLTVARNTEGTYTLTVTSVGEFSGTVALTCGGVPGGTTCAISPTQVTLSGSGSAQATVTIKAAQNASKGTHTLTFTGTSGSLNHKVTASLTID